MATKWTALFCLVALVVGLVIGHFAWTHPAAGRTETLTIYHAGSLAVPFDLLAEEFESTHPNVAVLLESGGSNAMISKWLTREDAGESPPDIMASADYSLIPGRTYAGGYADFYIQFGRNDVVLCYRDGAPGSTEIEEWVETGGDQGRSWYDVLRNEDVTYGHSNPDDDPCGYRAMMVIQLAEAYYYDRAAEFGLTPDPDAADLYNVLIPGGDYDRGRTGGDWGELVRSKSVDLVALLQSGDLDYAFEYRSVAVQHGLNFIELADTVNLSQTGEIDGSGITYEDFYYDESMVYVLKTPPPDPTYSENHGAPVVYGITIPENAPNSELAWEFINLLLSEQGQHILTDICGQPSIYPALCDAPENLPVWIEAIP